MKKIHLYSYYVNEENFKYDNDTLLERDTLNMESSNKREVTFAVKLHPQTHARIPISSKAGEVFYNSDTETYRVWFYEPNRNKAIEAIGNYILDRVPPVIRQHESFIARLENERLQAIKLLEDLPKQTN